MPIEDVGKDEPKWLGYGNTCVLEEQRGVNLESVAQGSNVILAQFPFAAEDSRAE